MKAALPLVLAGVAVCSGFVAPTQPRTFVQRSAASSDIAMTAEGGSTRRAVMGAFLLGAAGVTLPANAVVPGLTGPGLVKATPKTGPRPSWYDIRDSADNHFWSTDGIMNSVPKVKGIITPKTPVGKEIK